MKLIVGLGNPGKDYSKTRHNIGFMVIDAFANKHNLTLQSSKLKADICKTKIHGEEVILAKPTTYMNLSGEAVQSIKKFYQIENEDILVIYDDLDLEVGKIRLRKSGSSGGQNGIKNILLHLKTNDIARIRVGISKDKYIPTADYVLGKFTPAQLPFVEESVQNCVNALDDYLKNGFGYIMNGYNKKWLLHFLKIIPL